MTDPVEAGREEIDGTDTVKITGAIDAAAASTTSARCWERTRAPCRRADLEAALQEGVVEAWIGTEDLRPRRVHIVLKGDGTGLVEGVGPIDSTSPATLSAFDEPVDIQAPATPASSTSTSWAA